MNTGKIKVLEISSYPPPRAGWGMRVFFLKKEMERAGHVCTVLNTGKSRFLTGRDFVPVFGALDFALKVLKFRLQGFTIHMHLNGDSPKGFVLTTTALLISLLTLRRPVITFHAGPLQQYFPQSRAPKLSLLYKFIFTAPRHIICNSEVVKTAIVGYGITPQKIVPIQAFSKQYLQFDNVSLPEEIERFFQRHPQTICSYVFFRPEFFIEEMVKAMAMLIPKVPGCGLVILGSAAGSENLRELVRELGLDEHILLADDQDHDAFLTIISRAKLYLRTPVKDGVSSSVLEALALGVPVVAAENGTRPTSVITYENRNLPDMVAKLTAVLENHAAFAEKVIRPVIEDTIVDEIAVLGNSLK